MIQTGEVCPERGGMKRNGSTTRWRKTRAQARQRDQSNTSPCWLCGQAIDYRLTEGVDMWEPDHYWPVITHPHLQYDIANLRASHQKCNRNRGHTQPNVVMANSIGQQSRRW